MTEVSTKEKDVEDAVEFERAITLSGSFGFYQKRLLLFSIPAAITTVFNVSSLAYIIPAIICEFKITKREQGLMYSAIYLGMAPSGAVWGIVGDTIGRKKTMIITAAWASIFEFLASFSTGYWTLFGCKLMSGIATCGLHSTYYTYLSEFTDVKFKDSMTMITGTLAAFGYFVHPLLAVLILPMAWEYELFGMILLEPWRLFQIISSIPAILAFVMTTFVISETPKFMLKNGQHDSALGLMKLIYTKNTGNDPDTYPVKRLINTEEKKTEESTNLVEEDGKTEMQQKQSASGFKGLFRYPYLLPALLSFCAQAITMGAYNAVRPYQPTIFALSLGIGQNQSHLSATARSTPFCILFETQKVFKKQVTCSQKDVKLEPDMYLCTAVVGLFIFLSFFLGKKLVNWIGKAYVFLGAHVISAICIAIFPYSTSWSALLLMTIYSICMQNCLTLSIALIIGRIPTSLRSVAVSLVMVSGRCGVVIGNQVLPVISDISCYAGFWAVGIINLLAIPTVLSYLKQPNPLEEEAMKQAEEEKK